MIYNAFLDIQCTIDVEHMTNVLSVWCQFIKSVQDAILKHRTQRYLTLWMQMKNASKDIIRMLEQRSVRRHFEIKNFALYGMPRVGLQERHSVLEMLEAGGTPEVVAGRFGCTVRTLQRLGS